MKDLLNLTQADYRLTQEAWGGALDEAKAAHTGKTRALTKMSEYGTQRIGDPVG